MIVRIMGGRGQFEVEPAELDRLNEIDEQLGAAIEAGDQVGFRSALAALLAHVTSVGTPVADDEIVASDLVLPDPDATIDEVRGLLGEEGLIPG